MALKIKLVDPVEIKGKGTIKECVVQAPKLGWYEDARDRYPENIFKQTKVLVAKCIGLEEDDMGDFSTRDFAALEEALVEQSAQKKADTNPPSGS